MKLTDKQALQEWEQYLQSIREETAIDRAMPVAEREKRRQWLEAHPLEWIKELFPRFAKYDFAGFQKKAIASFGKPRRATGTRCSHGRVSCQRAPR